MLYSDSREPGIQRPINERAMIFGGRSLHDLSLSDFQSLIDDQVPEGPHIEYKETAYSGRPADIREMLRYVTALANAEGGYLVMGMREDLAGRAAALSLIDDPKTKMQAIHQACLDGIQERVVGLEVVSYEIGFNQGIIVVRVPPSEQRPHMMVRDHGTDFVCRYGTDSRDMTLGEIRGMINLCIPFNSIEWIGNQLSANSWASYSKRPTTPESMQQMGDRIANAPVEVVVELAETKITTNDLINLRVGDIIASEKDVRHPLLVYVEGLPKFHGAPGRFKGRKAIQILSSVEHTHLAVQKTSPEEAQ